MSQPNGAFRKHIGYGMVGFTLLYVAGVTTAWFAGCSMSESVEKGVMFCFGWLFAKAGTVVDFIYGTSQGSEEKTRLIARARIEVEEHKCCRD